MAKKILRRDGVLLGHTLYKPGQEKEFEEAAAKANVNLRRLEMAGAVEGFADVEGFAGVEKAEPVETPKRKKKAAKKKAKK